MKNILFFYFFFPFLLLGQSKSPMTFLIIDSNGNTPLKGASVAIKELGYQSLASGSDGNVHFGDVPVGEIHYFVIMDGYKSVDGAFNITTIAKNNSLRIVMTKLPSNESERILFSGEVLDNNKDEINGAEVELRIGNVTMETISDESGNFNIEVDLSKLRYNVNTATLEVSKGGCRAKEFFDIPKNNYIYKELILDCDEGTSKTNDGDQVASSEEYLKDNGVWSFQLKSWKKRGREVELDFEIKSHDRDLFFRIFGAGNGYESKLFDENGNEYRANFMRVANITNLGYIDRKLIAGVSYKGTMVFTGIPTTASKISLLEIYVNDGSDYYPSIVQFRDIKSTP